MTSDGQKNDGQNPGKVIEPEVLEPVRGAAGENYGTRGPGSGSREEGTRVTWIYGWPGACVDCNGCIAPAITLVIFFACWSQYGFLAALGFIFFHVVFGIAGSVQASRNLMAGRPFNPWLWRLGNWFLSFIITVWLAGGLKD